MPTNTRLDRYVEGVLPVVNGGTGGANVVNSVVAGSNVSVDNTDPKNPVVSSTSAVDSVNGQTGVVALDQDDVLDGITNKQYSATEQTKLAGIEDGAEVNTINAGDNVSLLVNDANYLAVGDDVSDLNNDAGYLTNNRAIRAVSANTTALQTDFTILVDATAGDVTITLPAAQTGLVLNCKKTDISSNAMIIDADGAETIDGELTQQTITQNATLTVQSDGSNWHII